VAHFVNRLVFCMFAEDVELLPDRIFSEMIDACQGRNAHLFEENAAILFKAMREKGGKVGFKPIEWFNGGLFDSDDVLPLTYQDIDDLKRAAYLDWSDIDPSIMGTLFERGLDPDKRSQLGAHYTDRGKIMQIVTPVIDTPLRMEWAAALDRIDALLAGGAKTALDRAEALHAGFVDRLTAFRILDPACGSGNFLSIALQVLKQIEHEANLACFERGQQKMALQTGPENMLGIELNPYAAELARVSVWIGDIQWSRRNGQDVAKNPILRTLNTIENRDAVLGPDGGRAEWPRADVVVGNPPFLGGKILRSGRPATAKTSCTERAGRYLCR
jgi:type II restriction/modification system DNA methylase subunit YeeA